MGSPIRGYALALPVVLATLCTGCANLGTGFLVDTDTSDPVIYRPGSTPGKALKVPLEGFRFSCPPKQILVSEKHRLRLSSELYAGASGIHKTAMAELDAQAAVDLNSSAENAHDSLTAALGALTHSKTDCPLSAREISDPDMAAYVAADIIRSHLPSTYSATLRHAYNHRLWPKPGETTTWISMDMLPGMRLRVENSVPIAPFGINSAPSHPSSFAAATYLYFHALSGAELCDPSGVPSVTSPHFCTSSKPRAWEETTFVSAAGGLARLGLQQTATDPASASAAPTVAAPRERSSTNAATPQSANTTTIGTTTLWAQQTSGLIDLLERTDLDGGAWRHWRLWLPAHRNTYPSKPITDERGGSSEDPFNTPMLRAANTIADLGNVLPGPNGPCQSAEAPTNWRCHSLHYRAVPVPEISISINGVPQWVPVGTTLGNLLASRLHNPSFASVTPKPPTALDSSARWAAGEGAAQHRALRDVQVFRRHLGALYPVVGSHDNAVRQHRFLRLQLLPGDEIKWH